MDIAEREAKILVYRGDNWQPPPPPPAAEPAETKETPPAPEAESTETKETTPAPEAQQQSETSSAQ